MSPGWSAIFTGILPRTRWLEPLRAHDGAHPGTPATSFSSLAMQAKRTRFSPPADLGDADAQVAELGQDRSRPRR